MGNRQTRINIDLGPYKQPWLAHCRRRGVTPSALFRQMAAERMAAEETLAPSATTTVGKVRKQVTLSAEERAYVVTMCARMGMTESSWIVALIRAQMTRQVQLGQPEVEVLGRSNLALLTVGRNLNQIARAANASGTSEFGELVNVLAALRVQLTNHVDGVAAVLSANMQRWRTT